MNKVIHKLELQPWIGEYELPADAKILHVAFQGLDKICLWYEAEVYPVDVKVLGAVAGGYTFHLMPRRFNVYPTGSPFKPSAYEKHIGTVVRPDGALVFHIYEDLP